MQCKYFTQFDMTGSTAAVSPLGDAPIGERNLFRKISARRGRFKLKDRQPCR